MENVVGFVGYECEDIAIYLAKILRALGKNIVLVDRTEQEVICEMFDLQSEKEETWSEGEYKGILLTNRGVCHDDYDFVFYLFGYRLCHPKLYECGTMIMVTDGVPVHASMLKHIRHWECKRYLLIRNLVPMKHTESYLAAMANKENEYFAIPYDERDVRSRCSLGAYTGCEIRRLSRGMQQVLLELICSMATDYKEKIVWERMKKL